MTKPVDTDNGIWTTIGSIYWNQEMLKKYHFVFADDSGLVATEYKSSNINNPTSPQLSALYGYAVPLVEAGTCRKPNNTSLQFMGEYLHAFEDTFSHRDSKNIPYDPIQTNYGQVPDGQYPAEPPKQEFGWGHGFYGAHTDYTYNHYGCGPLGSLFKTYCAQWNNEARTLQMERETYGRITQYMADMNYDQTPERKGKVTDLENPVLQAALVAFNAFVADEEENEEKMGDKIKVLNDALIELGYGQRLEWAPEKKDVADGYDKNEAARNRTDNFKGLKKSDYPRAILLKGSPK
jgi:hypothetical protein